MKNIFTNTAVVFSLLIVMSCSSSVPPQNKYGPVENALRNVALAVYGKYEYDVPSDFTADALMALLLESERFSEHALLKEYRLDLKPMDNNYLLFVYDGDALLMFDYYCTENKIDGALYRGDVKYFLQNTPCTQ